MSMNNTLNMDTGLVWRTSFMDSMYVNPLQSWAKMESDLNSLGYVPVDGEVFIVRCGNDYQRAMKIKPIQ
ncbi:MAG: hypothetical protein BMS9Abin33_1246 [Gammaproteobacteria bacterium]|nr:MAG: hypothetical protein BMS9Abin33_1246 [Gammaproteobacteria bacterium]